MLDNYIQHSVLLPFHGPRSFTIAIAYCALHRVKKMLKKKKKKEHEFCGCNTYMYVFLKYSWTSDIWMLVKIFYTLFGHMYSKLRVLDPNGLFLPQNTVPLWMIVLVNKRVRIIKAPLVYINYFFIFIFDL